jgi:protein CpxP
MIMYNMKTLALALLLISLIVAPAFAQGNGWGGSTGNGPTGEHLERLSQLLDLTPDQKADIKEIVAENRQRFSAQREAQRTNRQEVRELVAAETLNEARLRELLQEETEVRIDRMVATHTMRNQINQVLTPEQQEKHQALRQMRSQHKKFGKRNAGGGEAKAM